MTPIQALGIMACVIVCISLAYILGRKSREPELERLSGKLDIAIGESLRFQKSYAAKVEQAGILSLELSRAEDRVRDLESKVPARGPGGKFAARH